MKNLIAILGFLAYVNVAFSQILVQDNKSWNVVECMNFGGCTTVSYKLSGDTTINNFDYKKLYKSNDTTLLDWNLFGALRENQSKVFYNDFENEMLLYDFNLSVADTFKTTNFGCSIELVVNKIDTVTVFNGEQRQRYKFQNEEEWIKGIGSLYGIMEVGASQCSFDFFYDLNCCYENNEELVFKSPLFDNCIVNTMGIKEKTNSQHFTINPNPFDNFTILKFDYLSSQEYQIQIINCTGQIVKIIDNIKSGEIKITSDGLGTGIYYFRILNKNSGVISGKMIVK